MIIFLSMLIPFITAGILWIFFRRETKWWEFLIPFAASIILSLLVKLLVGLGQCWATEYWTGYVTEVEYFEDWKETVHYTERVPAGTETYRSGGHTRTRTKYKTVQKTRTDYHPAHWEARESDGCDFSITEDEYNRLKRQFGNSEFQDLHRNYCCGDDGDLWVSKWRGDDASMEVVTTTHSYQNRVANSNSVFKFPEVDPKQYGLFEYPEIKGHNAPSIMGDGGPTQVAASVLLDKANARLGKEKQVRIWLLVFKDQTLDAGYAQENYWKGSNKNEFVVCVGIDSDYKIQWGHVFSWTDKDSLKIETRNYINSISGTPLNLMNMVNHIVPEVRLGWERKNWHDFDYISIEPPMWSVILAFVLVAGLNVGVSFFVVKNDFKEDGVDTSLKVKLPKLNWRMLLFWRKGV